MPITTYTVDGMSCQHCVTAVREELGALAGVQDVEVDLDAGTVAVTSAGPLAESAVAAAVDEAGYTLTGTAP